MMTFKIQGISWPDHKTFIDEPIDHDAVGDMVKAIRAMERHNVRLLKVEPCDNCGGLYA